MKKRYLLIAIIICGALSSCNDLLDLDPDGRITRDQVFEDRYKTMGYLNSCYGYCPAPYMDRSSFCDEAEDADDNTSGSRYDAWYAGAVTEATYPAYSVDGSPWASLYEGIRKCNVFLENIWSATGYFNNEDERKGWAAQAHTLRALYYLQLIKRYGNVPVLDKPLGTDFDFSKVERTPFSKVVSFILADCDSALKAPATSDGFHWEVYNNQFGIMTRAVAYAIKSQAVTYAASALWADGTYSWADATAINKEALYQCLTHDYKLFDQDPSNHAAQNPYAFYFITSSNDQQSVDKETIYQCGGQMEVWKYAGLPSNPGMVKAGPCPTQDLIDCYEMANGELPVSGYSDANHLKPVINTASGYNPQNPYVGRDPRFYASIYYHGALRKLNEQNITAGLKFTASADFYAVNASCPSWGNNIGNLTFRLYKWKNSYSESTSGVPIAEKTFMNYSDNEKLKLSFNKQAAGDYVWELSHGTETVGVWKYADAGGPTESFYNGEPTEGNYSSEIAYTPDFTFTPLVTGNSMTPVQISDAQCVDTSVGGADEISQTNRTHTRTGYYLRKFNNWQSGENNNADGAVRLFRLAELYLNFAESAYQSEGADVPVTLGSDLTMSARDAVNAVRERAGMPDLPAGMSKETFEKRYRNERRVELAFEEHRYFDVRRWKILDQTDRFVTGMRIADEGNGLTYTRIKFDDRNCSSDKWLLYPINQEEVIKMMGITGNDWQNAGW